MCFALSCLVFDCALLRSVMLCQQVDVRDITLCLDVMCYAVLCHAVSCCAPSDVDGPGQAHV
jgi:hypothetical protein